MLNFLCVTGVADSRVRKKIKKNQCCAGGLFGECRGNQETDSAVMKLMILILFILMLVLGVLLLEKYYTHWCKSCRNNCE